MVAWRKTIHQSQGRGQEPGPMEVGHSRGPGEPVVQPATVYLPKKMGEEGVVWSGYVLSGSYLT
jgi:hypothetical protein